MASFKAPQPITSVRSHGATICVGCEGGTVCILQAPILAPPVLEEEEVMVGEGGRLAE